VSFLRKKGAKKKKKADNEENKAIFRPLKGRIYLSCLLLENQCKNIELISVYLEAIEGEKPCRTS
jgi:hypothetical protein